MAKMPHNTTNHPEVYMCCLTKAVPLLLSTIVAAIRIRMIAVATTRMIFFRCFIA